MRIFGSKREELAGAWRRQSNGEFHNLYASPNIFRVIKSRGMTLTGHVARMGESKMHTKLWSEKMNGREHSEYIGIEGKIILEWSL
jgi:hypothetical protein